MKYHKGIGLLSLLITIAIIALISSIILKFYFGSKTPAQEVHEGIDALDKAKAAKNMADEYNLKQQGAIQNIEKEQK